MRRIAWLMLVAVVAAGCNVIDPAPEGSYRWLKAATALTHGDGTVTLDRCQPIEIGEWPEVRVVGGDHNGKTGDLAGAKKALGWEVPEGCADRRLLIVDTVPWTAPFHEGTPLPTIPAGTTVTVAPVTAPGRVWLEISGAGVSGFIPNSASIEPPGHFQFD